MGKLFGGLAVCLALVVGFVVLIGAMAAQEEADACGGWGASTVGYTPPAGGVRISQANIPMNDGSFGKKLAGIVAENPDFVSLNEVPGRKKKELQPSGYKVHRGPKTAPVAQTRSTAVLYRTDRWRKLTGGRILMVENGPQKWDAGRSATWATLEAVDGAGGRVSVVSVHHMIDPARFALKHKDKRIKLYRAGMVRLVALVQELAKAGPVFVAGDFNNLYDANNSWGPRAMLGAIGMASTLDVLPRPNPVPHVDYIFFQPGAATATAHSTRRISDHPMIVADFTFTGAPASTESDVAAGQGGTEAVSAAAESAVAGYTSEQVRNAVAIIAAGEELEVPARGQAIAVMTAMGESGLRVLDHGDNAGPDSRGLFQQRDNGAWGTYEDRMDPRRSSLMFYEALLKVDGWETMEPTLAAHAVQRNADPYHYEKYWSDALALFGELTGSAAVAAALANGVTNQCDQIALVSAGTVAYPIPASMADSDRRNFGNSSILWANTHTGTDFSVPCGTPVYASTAGTIIVDTAAAWAGPHLVKVSTGEGQLTTWYAHMQKVTVTAGEVVQAGQKIGEVGSEGNSTGCHLHFELHPNGGSIYEDAADPSAWLDANVGKALTP